MEIIKEPPKLPKDLQVEQKENQEPTKPKPIFQGIGIIKGQVVFDEENKKVFVTFKNKTYPLYFRHLKVFKALKNHCQKVSEPRLIVYPEAVHFPGKDNPHKIKFRVVGFLNGKKGEDPDFDLKDFEFKLCGLWQFIPVCKTPCISVFKNFDKQRLEFGKTKGAIVRAKFMKAQHIPLFWWEALVNPFRFNPKLQKEEQAKRYFVEVKAIFMPHKDAFKFESLLGIPTEEIPRHFKASKQLKADAMAARKALHKGDKSKLKIVLKKKEKVENAKVLD